MSRRHDSEALRGLGVVSSIRPRENGKGFIFATDAQNTEIFIHVQACRPPELFNELLPGEKVSYAIAETPKGIRGHDVRRMTPGEEETYRSQQREYATTITDRRGNTEEHGERTSFVPTLDDGTPRRNRKRQ